MANGTDNETMLCAPCGAGRYGAEGRKAAHVDSAVETDADDWTEAEANAYINHLIERNKEALHGLAKL